MWAYFEVKEGESRNSLEGKGQGKEKGKEREGREGEGEA